MATPRKRAPRAKARTAAPDEPAATASKPKRSRRKKVVLAQDTATRFAEVPAQVTERVDEQDIIADAVLPAEPPPIRALVHVPTTRPAPRSWWRPAMSVCAVAAILLLTGAIAFRMGVAHRRPNAAPEAAPLFSSAPQVKGPSPEAEPARPSEQDHRALGHAAFAAGRHLAALRHYDHALRLDRAAVDQQMIDNLVACYGVRREQPEAAVLIVRFQLQDTKAALQTLERAGRTHGTRAGAHYTLEKLGLLHRDYARRETARRDLL